MKVELLGVVNLGPVAGIDDGYARCEKRTVNEAPPFVACMAYLGRGKLLSTLNVWDGGTAASTTAAVGFHDAGASETGTPQARFVDWSSDRARGIT